MRRRLQYVSRLWNTMLQHVNASLKSLFSSPDEYVTFPSCRMRWLADCLTPAASWLPLYSFSFFFSPSTICYSLFSLAGSSSQNCWEKKKKNAFFPLLLFVCRPDWVWRRESRNSLICQVVWPRARCMLFRRRKKKKDNEWEWDFNSNSCIEIFPSIYAMRWSVSNVLRFRGITYV